MDGLLLAAQILAEKKKTGNQEATLPNPYAPAKAAEEEKSEEKGDE